MGRTADRYCPDCGSRMTYDRFLSTPNVPNEFRIMGYWCMRCYNETGKRKIVTIEKHIVDDAVEVAKAIINQDKNKD